VRDGRVSSVTGATGLRIGGRSLPTLLILKAVYMKKITIGVDKLIQDKYQTVANLSKKEFTELMKLLKVKNNG
jgi:hypothetical protein